MSSSNTQTVRGSAWTLNRGVLRAAVAQAAVDEFAGKALVMGRCDCARLVTFVLERFGVDTGLGRFGDYRSETGAYRALRRTGFGSMEEAIESLGLERIAPARRLPGDLLSLPGSGAVAAMHVALSNGVTLGWGEGASGCTTWRPVLDAGADIRCWRALPGPERAA
ncbi:MAG: DUF6950 family protein [Caulobacter sp.]